MFEGHFPSISRAANFLRASAPGARGWAQSTFPAEPPLSDRASPAFADVEKPRSIFRAERRRKVHEWQADRAEDRVARHPVLNIELVEIPDVQLDRYCLHDLEGVADQRPGRDYPPFKGAEKAARAAVAGYLIIYVSADPGGPT